MNRGRQKYFFTPSISVLCIIASLLMGFTILPTGTDELRQSKPVSDSRSILTFKPWELVNALAWSPDGKWLAISAGNGIVIYQTADLRLVENLPLAALTQALAFSPDGKYLAAASQDGFLRVWGTGQSDPAGLWNPTPLWQTLAHRKGANALAYSADGAILASGGNDGMARLWQADTGKPLRAIIGGSFAVSALAFSPDATTLAVANSNVVRLRDPVNGRITGTLRAEKPLFSLSYRPDGRLLAVGDSDNHVFLWDPALAFRTGNLKYPEPVVLSSHHGLPGLARSFVWQVEFSPDGKRLASAGGDHTVRIWDVSRQVLLYTLAGHSDAVTSLAFSPDGKSLASGSLDGTVRIWDLGN